MHGPEICKPFFKSRLILLRRYPEKNLETVKAPGRAISRLAFCPSVTLGCVDDPQQSRIGRYYRYIMKEHNTMTLHSSACLINSPDETPTDQLQSSWAN